MLGLTASNPGTQAIGSWAGFLGLGTQAEAGDEQSWNTGYWLQSDPLKVRDHTPQHVISLNGCSGGGEVFQKWLGVGGFQRREDDPSGKMA